MDILKFLRGKLVPAQTPVSPAEVKKVSTSKEDSEMWKAYGITNEALRQVISDQNLIIYERSSIYQVVDRSLNHALMSAACVSFADSACQRSPLHGSTVWVTSENREYRYQIEKMLDVINIEECIYDWAWTTAAFGDLFVEVFGEPGVGIICVNDDNHPINVSRVDHNGRLVGFFQTPLGYATTDTRKLLAPWDQVHFRLLGAKKRRPLYQDQQYSEFRTISIMTPDARRLTSKYGCSILADALPIWKRLRLAEDSIMMARIMKSPQRFLFKVVIPEDNANAEAVAQLVDQYQNEIKRSRALNTDPNNPNYVDRFNAMAGAEDLIFPVWGQANNLTVETLGGECLRGDVRIQMLDGTSPTIKEMTDSKSQYIGKDIYACNKEGEVVGRRIKNVLMTRPQTNFVRVTLDSGEFVDCTPDHPFMLRNGEFKHAELLLPGESLMPLYTRSSENPKTLGYEEVYVPKTGKYRLTHRVVAMDLLADEYERKYSELVETSIEDYLVIHHKDFNKRNNDSSNLQWMGEAEHWGYHASLISQLNLQREGKTYEEMYGAQKAAEIKEKIGKGSTATNNRRWAEMSKEDRSQWFEEKIRPVRKDIVHQPDCGCNWCVAERGESNAFNEVKEVTCKHCGEHLGNVKQSVYANHVRWSCSGSPVEVLNHKVVSVERLDIIEDAYDLVIEGARDQNGGPEHCFALACGVFVHNTDIRWIVDVDKLEDQLITALKVPKQLLAGYSGEGGGGFDGGTALERMDIRFARQARRVQRSLIAGITRMAQIHLAWQGMDPDLNLFQIHMCEASSAEEVELQDALGKSVDATRGLYDMLVEMVGVDLDKKKLLEYFNEKFFKLSDLNLDELYMKGDPSKLVGDARDLPAPGEPSPAGGTEDLGEIPAPEEGAPEVPEEAPEEGNNVFQESRREQLRISDLSSALPNGKSQELWEATWRDKPVTVVEVPING